MSEVYLIDFVVILIILIPALVAFNRGFVKTAMGFLPVPVAIFCSYKFTPAISEFVRGTSFYENLRTKIMSSLALEEIISKNANQTDIINSIRLPEFLKTSLLENNNSVVHEILDVSGIKEYISGFLANICINVLVVILIFIAVLLIGKIVLSLLDLFAKLPVISFFNRTAGLLVGILQGLVIVWLLGLIVTYFFYRPEYADFFNQLYQTKVASYLYENNMLLFLVLKIFT